MLGCGKSVDLDLVINCGGIGIVHFSQSGDFCNIVELMVSCTLVKWEAGVSPA
jgi:hypothetical protein